MEDKRETIAENIAFLRKQKGLSQIELAEILQFSDKTVSKWERAESMPDLSTIYALAKFFNVSVDFFFHEDSKSNIKYLKNKKMEFLKRFLILLLYCISVYFVALIVMLTGIIGDLSIKDNLWISFVFATIICGFLVNVFFKKINCSLGSLLAKSVIIWTSITSVYLILLMVGSNLWYIYFVGIPLEFAVILFYFLKKNI